MSESISLDYDGDDGSESPAPSLYSDIEEHDDITSLRTEDGSSEAPGEAEMVFAAIEKNLEDIAGQIPEGATKITLTKTSTGGTNVHVEHGTDMFIATIFEQAPNPQPPVPAEHHVVVVQQPRVDPAAVDQFALMLAREDVDDFEKVRIIRRFASESQDRIRRIYSIYYERGQVVPKPHWHCRLCDSSGHVAQNCLLFPDIPLREAAVEVFRLCRRCLNKFHNANSCPELCRECFGQHSSSICRSTTNVRRLRAKHRQFMESIDEFLNLRQ